LANILTIDYSKKKPVVKVLIKKGPLKENKPGSVFDGNLSNAPNLKIMTKAVIFTLDCNREDCPVRQGRAYRFLAIVSPLPFI
jgi:hypothetical protein